MPHQYALEAAQLLIQTERHVTELLESCGDDGKSTRRRYGHATLQDFWRALQVTRDYVWEYLEDEIAKKERELCHEKENDEQQPTCTVNDDSSSLSGLPDYTYNTRQATSTLSDAVNKLSLLLEEHKALQASLSSSKQGVSLSLSYSSSSSSDWSAEGKVGATMTSCDSTYTLSPASSSEMTTTRVDYFPTKSNIDTMLFRLGVILQLCLVRIDYVQRTLCDNNSNNTPSTTVASNNTITTAGTSPGMRSIWALGEVCTLAGVLSTLILPRQSISSTWNLIANRNMPQHRQQIAVVLGTGVISLTSYYWLKQTLGTWWVMRKIQNSTHALRYFNNQWEEQQRRRRHFGGSGCGHSSSLPSKYSNSRGSFQSTAENDAASSTKTTPSLPENPRPTPNRLYKYQSALHLSEGEFRFLMIKRFMDVFYASVDTAVSMTRSPSGHHLASAQDWQLQLATAAAATYYSLTGASTKAVQVTSSSSSARQLLEKAWGMVSLPVIKSLSLHASRLAKGAAVADRIRIGDVSCFVLSREAVPELAASLRGTKKRCPTIKQQPMIHRLSTIDESREHEHVLPGSMTLQQPFARGDHRQRDVILHLTGGGFFAHCIASDFPYLLDWSHATGAVVVCPEYSLLPEKRFPCALEDVENVYQCLRDPSIVCLLGFHVNRVIITGESAGGNLAAALCVKLKMSLCNVSVTSDDSDAFSDTSATEEVDDEVDSLQEDVALCRRLPDAMLLSCPVLDLTSGNQHENQNLESPMMDPSASVSDSSDPVLSTGLVSAIADAYVPPGVRKNISLISPLYATDEVLQHFPPTLIFAASSTDPVLDGAVLFNQRLRGLGVSSDLRAVENLPHAYLGLGTAGFPEAQQAQEQIQAWLVQQLKE